MSADSMMLAGMLPAPTVGVLPRGGRQASPPELPRTTCPDCGLPATLETVEVTRPGQGRVRQVLRRCSSRRVGGSRAKSRWQLREQAGCTPVVVEEVLLEELVDQPGPRKEKTMLETRTCAECGADYQPVRKNQRFCRAGCRSRALRRKTARPLEGTCCARPGCGSPVKPRSRYCSKSCANSVNNARRHGPLESTGAPPALHGSSGRPEGDSSPAREAEKGLQAGEVPPWVPGSTSASMEPTPHHSRSVEEQVARLEARLEGLIEGVGPQVAGLVARVERLEGDSHPPQPGLALAAEVEARLGDLRRSWLALEARLAKQTTAVQDVDCKLSERLAAVEEALERPEGASILVAMPEMVQVLGNLPNRVAALEGWAGRAGEALTARQGLPALAGQLAGLAPEQLDLVVTLARAEQRRRVGGAA